MTTTSAVFSGTQQEAYELSVAVEHNCTCHIDTDTGFRTSICPVHEMILDSRILNGLDCERRRVAELLAQEFGECKPTDFTTLPYRVPVPEGPDGAGR